MCHKRRCKQGIAVDLQYYVPLFIVNVPGARRFQVSFANIIEEAMQLSQDEEGDTDDECHEVPAAGETPLHTRIIRELLKDDDNVEVVPETPSAEGSNF